MVDVGGRGGRKGKISRGDDKTIVDGRFNHFFVPGKRWRSVCRRKSRELVFKKQHTHTPSTIKDNHGDETYIYIYNGQNSVRG